MEFEPIDVEEEEESTVALSLTIELGDIIQIIAPTHQEIHEHIFLVDYVSSRIIKLIDTESLEKIVLKLDATGQITDESITTIKLISCIITLFCCTRFNIINLTQFPK